MTSRVVALIDMDCFYCQVETRLRPELIGTPVAVVQYKTWKGGGIIAVNYEARAAGVTRFMRGDEAKATCPSITLCSVPEVRGKAGLTRYRNAGREVIQVFSKFCRCVERASVDEAFIDLTDVVEKRMDKPITPEQLPNTFVVGFSPPDSNELADGQKGVKDWLFSLYDSELDDVNTKKLAVGAAIIEEIRAAVYEETGFRCSAGIAHNKIIAKLAAGLHKPNRQTVLPQSGVPILFKDLPVKKVRNLGGKLGNSVMEQLDCKVMGDLMAFSLKDLQQRFDEKSGTWIYNIARGIDHEPVAARLLPKSIGCSKRFPGNSALATLEDVWHWLSELSGEISERLKDDQILNERTGKVLTVMASFRTPDGKWSSFTRSGPLHSYEEDKIVEASMNLIKKSNTASAVSGAWSPPLINLGLSVGKFIDTPPGFNKIKQFFSTPSCSKSSTDKKDRTESVVKSSDKSIPSFERSETMETHEPLMSETTSVVICISKDEETSNRPSSEASFNDCNAAVGNVKQSSNQKTNPETNQPKKEAESILKKYFKKNRNRNAGRSEDNETSNNEESDASKDGFPNLDNSDAKSILISGNEKFTESIDSPARNFSGLLDRELLDKPSTSFFKPNGNSTTLEIADSKNQSSTLKDHSDCSNEPSIDTDDSSDCWNTLSEIFPDLENIDFDVFQLLPKKLQNVLYGSKYGKKLAKNSGKPQNEESHAKTKTKPNKGKSGKNVSTSKDLGQKSLGDTTLSQYFFRAVSGNSDIELKTASSKTLNEYFNKPNIGGETSCSFDSHSTIRDNIKSVLENETRMDQESTEIHEGAQNKDYGLIKNDELAILNEDEGETKNDELIVCDNDEQADNDDEDTHVSSCDLFEGDQNDIGSAGADDRQIDDDDDLFEKSVVVQNLDSLPCQKLEVPEASLLPADGNETCVDKFSEVERKDDSESSDTSGFNLGQEISRENDSQIVNRLTPIVLSDQTVDLSTKKCSVCDESIIVAAMPEHLDYHAALSLHKELNAASELPNPQTLHRASSSNVSVAKSSSVSKSTGGKSASNSGNASLKRKKQQPAKNSKKSMNIASFFSTR